MSLPHFDSSVLIRTKLYPPRGIDGVLARLRLLDVLQQSIGQRLTMLSAPAGYGKTTLLHSWLKTVDRPWAWLSLDEHDNNLTTFVVYLAAAVQSAYAEAVWFTQALSQSPAVPDAERLADIMVRELEELPGR